MNTFTFHSIATADRWTRSRCVGQRRLIASVDVPRTYARLYRSGFRRTFRSKFPNIQRIGIDNWSLFCEYDELRRLPENKGKAALDMWVEAKAKIIEEIKAKEGHNVYVEWHGQYRRDASDSPLLRPPPELRNRIYNYVLGSYLVFLVPRNDFNWFANARCGPRSKDFKAIVGLPTPQGMNAVAVPDKGCILALLCRQICIEARMLPFAVNEIR
ncbi:hypothetical protein SLS61_008316, partial [Didymella pomorum]